MVVKFMYSYMKGTITEITPSSITLEVSGIGYSLLVGNPFGFKQNEEMKVYLYQHVREDVLDLYGFKTKDEKELFINLISVKGIGPKSALSIIASGSVNDIKNAIENGNSSYLMKFPGIGQKASQQIILDLKGKITFGDEIVPNQDLQNVEEALLALGYKRQEVSKVLPKLDKELNLDGLIKQALKMMLK